MSNNSMGGRWRWVGAVLAVALVWTLAGATSAWAQDIRIVKRGSEKTDIDLSGLKPSGQGANLVDVLKADLIRSGAFTVSGGGAAIAVRGSASVGGDGAVIEAEVLNVGSGVRFFSKRYAETSGRWRQAAHRLADDIVKAVTGKNGIASTRIVMVGASGRSKNLFMCDADGEGRVQLTQDNAPCMSPVWTPDARSIYYMSFHRGFPDIYRLDLDGRRRESISRYPGINTGPAVAPNGQQLALVLSRDGNPELYVMQLGSGRLQRLTRTRQSVEASPTWSPDGAQLAFVADRTGAPHVYVMSSAGGAEKRVSMRGTENVNPDWGPDGRLVYSSRREGRYQVCVLNPATGEETQLTGGGADYEEPSWAPNGRHIVVARTAGYHTDLYILDTLGDPEVRLTKLPGDWYSPAWSPR